MYKKISFLVVFLITCANATNITKASISKLIDRSYMLEKRVKLLEEKVAYLTKNKIELKTQRSNILENTFYIPRRSGFIREAPYKKAKAIAIANKKVQILKIFCRDKYDIFWGKSNKGWIYIANPKYGKIVDANNNTLGQDYIKWCKD